MSFMYSPSIDSVPRLPYDPERDEFVTKRLFHVYLFSRALDNSFREHYDRLAVENIKGTLDKALTLIRERAEKWLYRPVPDSEIIGWAKSAARSGPGGQFGISSSSSYSSN